jgi:hypothetical protein
MLEFTKRNKLQDTAKNAGFGIANAATTLQQQKLQQLELNQATKTALAYTTLAESMKDSHKESMEQMLKMFKDILGTLPTADKGTAPTPVPAPNAQRPKCPHCNLRHVKPEDCWELEANASKRPANWKPVAERKKRTPEDAGSKRQLSSGNRGKSISGNEIPISLTWLQLALLLHQYYPKTNRILRDINRRCHRGRDVASAKSNYLQPTQHFKQP